MSDEECLAAGREDEGFEEGDVVFCAEDWRVDQNGIEFADQRFREWDEAK